MIYKLHLFSSQVEIRRYRTASGVVPLTEWLGSLAAPIGARIQAYIDRMKMGNFGHSRSIGGGALEMKANFGAGYRVYYLRDGRSVVLLLCGGDKGSQESDIRRAKEYARDYWRRK